MMWKLKNCILLAFLPHPSRNTLTLTASDAVFCLLITRLSLPFSLPSLIRAGNDEQ